MGVQQIARMHLLKKGFVCVYHEANKFRDRSNAQAQARAGRSDEGAKA